jgi:hypothetical protein
MKLRSLIWLFSLLLTATVVLTACGGGEKTITGTVTAADKATKTFTVHGKDGKDYQFKLVDASKADIDEIKEHEGQTKEIEVRYKGSTPPYEVTFAD